MPGFKPPAMLLLTTVTEPFSRKKHSCKYDTRGWNVNTPNARIHMIRPVVACSVEMSKYGYKIKFINIILK
jgi:hypothetical protein